MNGFDGLVRVEFDEDGTLRDLDLSPRVAYLPVEELRDVLFRAFTEAQEAARPQAPADYSVASARELNEALTEASDLAERRFAEVSTALYDITRRAGRSW